MNHLLYVQIFFGFGSAILFPSFCFAQDAFEQNPINYSVSTPSNPIAKLQQRIDSGNANLEFEPGKGYLSSLLKELDVSTRSQMLVYSKTSLQLHRISPVTPRAIFFNDNVYIGFIPGSDKLEISAADPDLGSVFYVLDQNKVSRPQMVRDQGSCLACHASSRTGGIPGHLMRSVYTSPNGQPHYGMGTYLTNHESPFTQRWGGWYSTGTHGNIRHLGNTLIANHGGKIDRDSTANQTGLPDRIGIDRYPTKHSDLVAMMVLAHQVEMHNLITLVNFQTRQAFYHGKVMNKALDRPVDFISDSTRNRIENVVEKLVRYMLFADEASLSSPISGTSGFKKDFQSQGPFDTKGRSLRQFNLETRTFKYPCSYLIYSKSFQQLPSEAKKRVYRRLWEILTGKDQSGVFANLAIDDRHAILEILNSTIKELPAYWRRQTPEQSDR